jgi:hypothetical protein
MGEEGGTYEYLLDEQVLFLFQPFIDTNQIKITLLESE